MDCPSCARSNRPGARFCGGCSASLAPHCPACGASNDPDARFCDACGGSLASSGARSEPQASEGRRARPAEKAIARKVVTVVFADLIGSVSLHERLDPESARRVIDRYHRAMTAAVEVHGGKVIQLLGDGVLAAFGVPRVAEDDAIRAVRAGAGMQRAFRELVRERGAAMDAVGLRVAVNTGEVVVSDDETAVIGDPTNVAARLQQEARDGDVLVGEGTQRLVGDLVTLAPLGSFVLRGRSESVAAFRLVSLDRPASARATAFVGRDDELRRLVAVYDAAVAAPGARLAVLLGSPGFGKSRLVAELARRVGERATVLAARCDAAGGATFAPIADALRAFLRIEEGADGDVLRAAIDAVAPGDEAERARIAAGIGALFSGAPSSPEEIFFAVRRLLAALAAVRPVVLAIDDLHWGEPLLLDLVEHLVQWSSGVRLFLIVAARPELRDARSSLAATGPLVADVVTLGGLDAGASMQLAAGVVGASELPAALVGRVLATSEGNPLFLSELVRMLVQDGTLAREGDRWVATVEVSKLDMPPTIHVLLAARIERLRPEDRTLLERAAVIGRHFSRSAVAELLGRTPDLDARLEALRRSELIEPDTGWFLGEPALRFHHMLIRDAAYRRVLKETRAELHERFADWVVARSGDSNEHDETSGWHLEQAHQNLRELGALDAHGRSLGERAARHLGAAGRRALARDDLALAASLLGRAIERLERDDPARADLALEWCEALLAAGEVGAAAGAVAELGRLAAGSERLGAWHACFAGQLAALTDPQSLRATAGEVARAAAVLAAAGDAAGEAKAHSVHAAALARLGEIGACETALDHALAAARRARDRRRSNAVLAGAPVAALWGPSPVTRASGRCLDVVRVLRITQGAPAVEAVALRCQAVLETLRGRADAARRMIAASRKMVEDLGIAQQLLESDVFAGLIELLQGDAEAAETALRRAYEGLRAHGLGIDAARAAALLGRALLAQDRAAEAESLSRESEALGGDDLKAAIAWRGVRAEALAKRGETEPAVELARAAVAIASATDALLDHADARMALATALRAAGRSAEAAAEETRAVELWETKGATLLTARVSRPDAAAAAPASDAPLSGDRARTARPRVRPNAATESAARTTTAIAARDLDALWAHLADDTVEVHHQTGAVLDAAEARRLHERLFAAEIEGFRVASEPVATLGEHLALARSHISVATARVGDSVSVGATDMSSITLVEVGADGLRTNTEFFATDRLPEAVVRLYERDAALLPEGPERDAAARRARAVAAIFALAPLEPLEDHFTPATEFIDHRVLGLPSLRGIEALRRSLPAIEGLADDVAVRVDDVLALDRDAFVLRSTVTGTGRESGGRFERPLLQLRCFAADGRITRTEFFEIDREAAALARFDELTRADAPLARRVPPNAATANIARLDAAMAARDMPEIESIFAAFVEAFHHPLQARYEREGAIESLRTTLAHRELVFRSEPIASLGERLALCRQRVSSDGVTRGGFDVGVVDFEHVWLIEVDEEGRRVRAECFAPTELAAATARLYDRYAELSPEGAERERAATTARCVGALMRVELEAIGALSTDDCELHDHRRLGFFTGRGRAALERSVRVQRELSEDLSFHVDEILDLAADAFLTRSRLLGRDRRTGGRIEREQLSLRCFGPDGRQTRADLFDVGQQAEALARFAARAGSRTPAISSRRVQPNLASAAARRVEEMVATRDAAALEPLFGGVEEFVEHATGASVPGSAMIETWGALLRAQDPALRQELMATLGATLALVRGSMTFSGLAAGDLDAPFGAVERSDLVLIEVDGAGRPRRFESFPPDALGAALVRLYERHAELAPEGPARERAATTARCVAGLLRGEPALVKTTEAGTSEFRDHRRLGLLRSGRVCDDDVARYRESFSDLTENVSIAVDEILCARPNTFLVRTTTRGRDRRSGGAFEQGKLDLRCFDAAGRLLRSEWFDADREADALARYDELAGETPPSVRSGAAPAERPAPENAATRAARAFVAAMREGRSDALERLFADDLRSLSHETGVEMSRDEMLTRARYAIEHGVDMHVELVPLAALGDRLTLHRMEGSAREIADPELPAGEHSVRKLTVGEAGADGRLRWLEEFPEAQIGRALARLYERWAAMAPETEHARAAIVARAVPTMLEPPDPELLAPFIAPDLRFADRRTLGMGSGRGVERYLRGLRALLDMVTDLHSRDEVLAADERALLIRRHGTSTLRESGGAVVHHHLMLWIFGADGRITHLEMFDPEAEHAAFARRADLVASPPAESFGNAAWRAVLDFVRAWRERRRDDVVAAFCPDFELVDRRAITGIDLRGSDFLRTLRLIFDTPGSEWHTELLATRGERHVLLRALLVAELRERGRVEWEHLGVFEFDAHGRHKSLVLFDTGHVDAAYAELDARWAAGEGAQRSAPAPSDPLARWLRPNTAVAAHARLDAAASARDWAAMRARFTPDARVEDRRAGLRTPPIDADTAVDWMRDAARRDPRMHSECRLLAVFGDSVSLETQTWRGGPPDGPYEIEMLTLIESDAEGRVAALVSFDPGDVVEAHREASERWLAREPQFAPLVRAGLAYGEATRARDAAALRALLADDLVVEDRRRTGFGPLAGADALVESFRAVWQLTQQSVSVVRARVAREPWGSVLISHVTGTLADGGAFEGLNGAIVVFEDGRFRRFEFFELEDMEDALARFEAMRAERERRDPLARWLVPNAAIAAHARLDAACFAHDWAAMRARFATDARVEDRRAGLRTPPIDADTAVAWMRDAARRDPHMRAEYRLFALFGDRVSLEQQTWRGGPPDRPYEIEMLTLIEAGAEGRVAALVSFDPEDVVEAQREAMRRWIAQRPPHADVLATVNALFDAWNERDVAAVRRILADDLVFLDRRRTGSGLLEGAAAYAASLATLLELSPDARLEARVHLAVEAHGTVAIARTAGTQRDGGDFEQLRCTVAAVADGRLVRLESFEIEHVEAALARFAELRAERTRPDPLRIPENSAARIGERVRERVLASDWDGLRALCAAAYRFADRRRLARTEGDRDMLVANSRHIPRSVWERATRTLLATSGDRLALHRLHGSGDPNASGFEIEWIEITEIDAEGRLVASILFDVNDRPAANWELIERWFRSDEHPWTWADGVRYTRAQREHDVDAMRAILPDDFYALDLRRTGAGHIDKETWLRYFAATIDLSSDVAGEFLYHVAVAGQGSLSIHRSAGNDAEGGAFEWLSVRLNRIEDGVYVGMEIFEIEHLDRAKARFEELGRAYSERRRDPLRIPENAATRADLRWGALIAARDWDGLRGHFAPDLVYEDRRRLFGASGGRDALLANVRLIAGAHFTVVERSLLATSGDRLSLTRNVFRGGDPGAPAEIEVLQLLEVDEGGRIAAVLQFDADDRRAAAIEMLERYMRGEGARTMPASQIAFLRAMEAHDLAGMRAALDDDFGFVDHRRTGLGNVGNADDYIASVAALMEQSDDFATDVLYHVAIAQHGSLSVGRMFGTLRDGGPFESVFVRLNRYENGRNVGGEIFEIEDLERAKARFAELGRALAAPVPNAAWHVWEPLATIVQAGDWDALRARVTPDFAFEDRQRRSLVRGDVELYVRNLEFVRSWPGRRVERTLLVTAGDRLALDRIAFVGDLDGGAFEGEFLRLTELGADGLLRALLHFDANAQEAAHAEMRARFAETRAGD